MDTGDDFGSIPGAPMQSATSRIMNSLTMESVDLSKIDNDVLKETTEDNTPLLPMNKQEF